MAGKWGGHDAVNMPDLQRMTACTNDNPDTVATTLEHTMKTRFPAFGLRYGDSVWRNVPLVRNADGDLTKAGMIDIDHGRKGQGLLVHVGGLQEPARARLGFFLGDYGTQRCFARGRH